MRHYQSVPVMLRCTRTFDELKQEFSHLSSTDACPVCLALGTTESLIGTHPSTQNISADSADNLSESDEATIKDPWWLRVHKDLRTGHSPHENHVRLRDNLLADASSWGIVAALILTITLPLTLTPPIQTANAGIYSDDVIVGVTNAFVFCMGMASLLLTISITVSASRFQAIQAISPQRIVLFLKNEPCFIFGIPIYPNLVANATRSAYNLFVAGTCAGIFLSAGWVPCIVAVALVLLVFAPCSAIGGSSNAKVLDMMYEGDAAYKGDSTVSVSSGIDVSRRVPSGRVFPAMQNPVAGSPQAPVLGVVSLVTS